MYVTESPTDVLPSPQSQTMESLVLPVLTPVAVVPFKVIVPAATTEGQGSVVKLITVFVLTVDAPQLSLTYTVYVVLGARPLRRVGLDVGLIIAPVPKAKPLGPYSSLLALDTPCHEIVACVGVIFVADNCWGGGQLIVPPNSTSSMQTAEVNGKKPPLPFLMAWKVITTVSLW